MSIRPLQNKYLLWHHSSAARLGYATYRLREPAHLAPGIPLPPYHDDFLGDWQFCQLSGLHELLTLNSLHFYSWFGDMSRANSSATG
jgi:hypothetical protein